MDENNSSKILSDPGTGSGIVDPNSKTYDGSINALLDEAGKILEIEAKKDFCIREKDKIIQISMETIENLRKSLIHIQTEHEMLKLNYEKEVSNAAEVSKRIDKTKNMLETTDECSQILAASIHKLEDDKLKLIEYYEGLRQKLEVEEEKRKKMEIIVQEHQNFTENVSQLIAEKTEMEQRLKNELFETGCKLECEKNKSVLLEKEIKKSCDEINELRSSIALEQTARVKYQINQEHLRKRILSQKGESEKNLKQQQVLHNMKLKFLKNKLKNLKRRLLMLEDNISSNLERKDCENIINCPDEKESEVSPNDMCMVQSGKIIGDNYTQTNDLNDLIKTMEEKVELKNKEISTLRGENMNLMNAQEVVKILLQEKENKIKILQEEISTREQKIEELLLEINKKSLKGKEVTAAVQTSNSTEGLSRKIKIYEKKLANYEAIEKELRSEILLLREDITKKGWKNETEMLENRTEILRQENEISKLQEQKEATEKELKEIRTQFTQVKSELTVKSADLDKITAEFAGKMKIMTNKVELFKENCLHLEKERQLNKELLERVKKLEKDSEMLKICQETNNSLKKSLETCEANEQAYKLVIQKLEEELAGRKNKCLVENQINKKPKLETIQLKQFYPRNENTENRDDLPETSKSRYNTRGKF